MARSRADSRLRWAATIEKVLWMLNDATSRAMPANTSSIVDMIVRKSVLDGLQLLGAQLRCR